MPRRDDAEPRHTITCPHCQGLGIFPAPSQDDPPIVCHVCYNEKEIPRERLERVLKENGLAA